MATVKLSDYECRRDLLPGVCMVCGAPADVRKSKNFSWYNPLAYLGLLAGLVPFLIIALVLTKRMTVRVPLCQQHQSHWSKRTLWVLGTFLAAMAVGIGAFAYMANQQPPNDDAGWVCLACVGLLFVWLVAAAIIQSSAIRPTEITDTSITLTKVHPDFVEALREERARIREEGGGRRRDRYGDVRDDYDDQRDDAVDDEPRPRRRRPRDDRDEDDRYDDERPARRPRD
jgi:hypothetical protein